MPQSWDEIKGLIERVDEVCRDAERARNQANDAMRRRPFWPDRRQTPRDPDEPPRTRPTEVSKERP
jgi:hypothetical protein